MSRTSRGLHAVFAFNNFQTFDQAGQQFYGSFKFTLITRERFLEVDGIMLIVRGIGNVLLVKNHVTSELISRVADIFDQFIKITSCDAVEQVDPFFELPALQNGFQLEESVKVSVRNSAEPAPIDIETGRDSVPRGTESLPNQRRHS